MSLLIYSEKCEHSRAVLEFIRNNPKLRALPFAYHDIHKSRIPRQLAGRVTRVPTMVTKDGKMLLGKEIRAWLQSLLPHEEVQHQSLGGGCAMSTLDGGEGGGDYFDIDSYGASLQPAMTAEIEAKINQEVKQVAYSDLQVKE